MRGAKPLPFPALPQTHAATEARREKCAVVVAKLDRLSRDVHFISGLLGHVGVRFVHLDPPELIKSWKI